MEPAAGRFFDMAYTGNRDGALSILDERRALIPRSGQPNAFGSWWLLVTAIEGLAMLGEQSQAAELYPLACELVGTEAVTLWGIPRFTQTIAGLAASSARKWEAAEEHFEIALQQAESFPDRLEKADIRRFHAMMLLDRAAPTDRTKAQTLLKRSAGDLHADRNAAPYRDDSSPHLQPAFDITGNGSCTSTRAATST
jgi:hypothetical protein